MDESTSALDTANERVLYQALRDAGITFVSVGHRWAAESGLQTLP
jgi:putative ATP-binding cassette transporter